MDKQVVLITGASSGIGKAAAEFLMKKGFHVYGTSRKSDESKVTDPQTGGFIQMVSMDVTSDLSIQDGINAILAREGRIDILVSNAGAGIAGSIEDVSIEEAKYQFEVNVFGALRAIRAALPSMRKQKSGKIIAVSSVAGLISIPYQAHYSASKFAIEGFIEALRYEVAPFGIKACSVEPGDTKTSFTQNRIIAKASTESSPYYNKFRQSLARMERDEQNGVAPEKVAAVIYKMIKKKNPPVRTTVGFHYKAILFLKRILPTRIVEALVGMFYN